MKTRKITSVSEPRIAWDYQTLCVYEAITEPDFGALPMAFPIGLSERRSASPLHPYISRTSHLNNCIVYNSSINPDKISSYLVNRWMWCQLVPKPWNMRNQGHLSIRGRLFAAGPLLSYVFRTIASHLQSVHLLNHASL